MSIAKIELSRSRLLVSTGDGLFAWGKLAPGVIEDLQQQCLVGSFHAALMQGADVANEWLERHGFACIQDMEENDKYVAEDHPKGWLLARIAGRSPDSSESGEV